LHPLELHYLALALFSWHDACMADPADRSISADQLHGMKQLRRVAGLLSHLHEAGCDRDQAGNRELHFDDYVLLILLYLFNPLIDSMRTLQRVSELPEIQSRLGIKRFSLGSFSESCRVFDPAMLQAVVDELAEGLLPVQRAALLRDLPGKLTLVDSTVIQTLCTVTEAMFLPLGTAGTATPGDCICNWRWTIMCRAPGRLPSRRTPAGATRRACFAAICRRVTPT
jgi:hypothetical protein